MKIVMKYILSNVREHKARTLVMMLSIMLSTVLLFVSFSIGKSYEAAQQKMAKGMAGSATISVESVNGDIQISDIPELSEIKSSVGIVEQSALYQENGYYEVIDLKGAELEQLNKINKPVIQNECVLSEFSGNQIILPDRFTSKYGIKQGDTVSLQVKGQEIIFHVAAIASYDTVFLRSTRGTTALLPADTLKKINGMKDEYNKVLIEPINGITTDDLSEKLQEQMPSGTFKVLKIVNEEQIEADARQKSMPFFLITFFSMTMSVFIIYSSYKVITLERLPSIGTFRSIGATQKKMTLIMLVESFIYGCMGGVLGIPLGVLVLRFLLRGMGETMSQGIEIPVIISGTGVILSILTAIIISLLSAWIPVQRASRLPIKEVLSGNIEEKKVPKPFIVVIGITLFVISAILPHWTKGKMLYLAGGFSLLGLIVATILMIPILTNVISFILEKIYGFLFGNLGKLSVRNMKDNKGVSENITLLFISISAIIAINVVGNFVTTYISDVFDGARIEGFADGHMDQAFIEQVKGMNGIETVMPEYVFKDSMQADGVVLSRVEGVQNLEEYSSMFAIHYTDESQGENAKALFQSEKRTIVLSDSCMERTGYSIGDSICLSNDSGENRYVVTGSFKSRATDVEAVIQASFAMEDFGVTEYDFLGYTADDPETIMVQIRDLFGDTQNWSRTVEEFNEDALSTVGTFLQPMHSMTYFILFLAAIGVINNLLINYMQKRHIIAMYKSIGLSNKQNIKMTTIESITSGLIGAVIAIGVSYMEIKTIFIVAGPKISMIPQLEIKTFLSAGCMGILLTLFGSIIPIFRITKMKLIEELKFE